MVDRTTVLPPLVHAVLDCRDRLPWGPPTTAPDGITARTATVPYCVDGVVVRFTATLPDIHASALALLFTKEIDHGDVGGESALFECDLSPQDFVESRTQNRWLFPGKADSKKFEEALFVGGGENPEAEDCPAGFPDCHPSCCPIVPRESLTYFASETPKHRTRDFVVRLSPVVNLCTADVCDHDFSTGKCTQIKVASADTTEEKRAAMSPRSRATTPDKDMKRRCMTDCSGKVETDGLFDLTMAREAAAISPHHDEAYAFAGCSCSGAIPAVKRAVRSGLLCSLVVSSETKETVGCDVDMCYAFHVALPPNVAAGHVQGHFQQYLSQAKFLTNEVFGGKAVDVQDPAVAQQAVAALRRKKRDEIRAAAANAAGFCCCCTLQ